MGKPRWWRWKYWACLRRSQWSCRGNLLLFPPYYLGQKLRKLLSQVFNAQRNNQQNMRKYWSFSCNRVHAVRSNFKRSLNGHLSKTETPVPQNCLSQREPTVSEGLGSNMRVYLIWHKEVIERFHMTSRYRRPCQCPKPILWELYNVGQRLACLQMQEKILQRSVWRV